MNEAPLVRIVHPNPGQRLLLRSILEDHGRTVRTDPSWSVLLADRSEKAPAVILLKHSFVDVEGVDVLTLLRDRWPDAEILLLPEALEQTESWRDTVIQLLRHLDRLTAMQSVAERTA